MVIQENVSLKPFNTFGIDAKAKYFCEVQSIDEFISFVQTDLFKKEKRLILGGGSNVLFTKDFDGLIISVTKFGFFVELTDLFVEGLVPLATLIDDHYTFHENTREIIGQRSRRTYRLGQRVRVLVDRIDPVEKKIQFALLEETPKPSRKRHSRRRS